MNGLIIKDPQAKLDYGFDWSPWLYAGDTITDSAWDATGTDALLMQSAEWFNTRETGVWLSGGTLGGIYAVTNHIVTAQGREEDQTLHIQIAQR